ncbi:MAG TPA: ferrous iron transport protein B [Clostridiales bacterium]|nr:ferrous iron transport protein B [Clostridiales bacterium]
MVTGITVALVGNPNSGKTTLFNTLTGSRQYVGNWPGVTVEKKEGMLRGHTNRPPVKILDLPGIYSLSPYTLEEMIARQYIIQEKPDVMINVVDATNLERSLYLTLQLLELGRPVVLALNMMDEVNRKGDRIDIDVMSRELGIPVVPITARDHHQVRSLLEISLKSWPGNPDSCLLIKDPHILSAAEKIGKLVQDAALQAGLPEKWAALKVLEEDEPVLHALEIEKDPLLSEAVTCRLKEFSQAVAPRDKETVIAEDRYHQIEDLMKQAVCRRAAQDAVSWSDRIDGILTNRILALPIFFLLLFLVFTITFGQVGRVLSDAMDQLINHTLRNNLSAWMMTAGFTPVLQSLLLDGIVAGVGGILVFLPQILLLFFFLSLLEDTGYMARAAFIMDQLLRKIGLSGKAFIPMIIGFGCTVPAILATRTIENERDRRLTILLTPFMSCSARFPIYALFAGTFFTASQGPVIFSIYALGVLAAILSGLLLKNTVLRGEPAPFVMEMPPYRFPQPWSILRRIYDRGKDFIVRAGTVILVMSLVVWMLQTFTFRFALAADNAGSMFGQLGRWLAPVFAPLGFGTWQAAVSLLTGFVAKEAVVSTMGILYSAGDAAAGNLTLGLVLKNTFTPLSAYAFMTFCLLYISCIAAFGTIHREMRSWKWTFMTAAWQTGVAYLAALLIYQGGRLLGFD